MRLLAIISIITLVLFSCESDNFISYGDDAIDSRLTWKSQYENAITGSGERFPLIDEVRIFDQEEVDYCDNLRVLLFHGAKTYMVSFEDLERVEVINFSDESGSYVITHCPITKTTRVFRDTDGRKWLASGYLYHDNLVLTDNEENGFYPQITTESIALSSKEFDLQIQNILELRFDHATRLFPTAQVITPADTDEKFPVCKDYQVSYDATLYYHVMKDIKEQRFTYSPYAIAGVDIDLIFKTDSNYEVIYLHEENTMTNFKNVISEIERSETYPFIVLKDQKGLSYNVLGQGIDHDGILESSSFMYILPSIVDKLK